MRGRNDVGSSPQQQAVRVHVPPDVRYGVYANLAVISHSAHEFTLDLCQVPPEAQADDGAADLVTRVHLPPTLIPSLIRALQTNLEAYQGSFGSVRDVHTLEPGG